MDSKEKNRISYFDLAKGIAIVLVVFGHSKYCGENANTFLSTFHLPLFFVISGMLMALKNTTERPLRDILRKRAKGILIPYFWFSLSYVAIDLLHVLRHAITVDDFISHLYQSVSFRGYSAIWFLPVLFLAEMIAVIILKRKTLFRIIAVLVLLIGLPFAISAYQKGYGVVCVNLFATTLYEIILTVLKGFLCAVFVVAGFYAFKLIDRAEKKWSFLAKSICSLIIGIICLGVEVFVYKWNGLNDLNNLGFISLYRYYLLAIIGCAGVIFICKGIRKLSLLEFFGRNSLVIMATHLNYYILYMGILAGDALILKLGSGFLWLGAIVALIVAFLISSILIYIINRWFRFVIGR